VLLAAAWTSYGEGAEGRAVVVRAVTMTWRYAGDLRVMRFRDGLALGAGD